MKKYISVKNIALSLTFLSFNVFADNEREKSKSSFRHLPSVGTVVPGVGMTLGGALMIKSFPNQNRNCRFLMGFLITGLSGLNYLANKRDQQREKFIRDMYAMHVELQERFLKRKEEARKNRRLLTEKK